MSRVGPREIAAEEAPLNVALPRRFPTIFSIVPAVDDVADFRRKKKKTSTKDEADVPIMFTCIRL